jgi:NADH:ubiquinone oxidoreductase subunit 6 (subunit J)
MQLVIYVGGTLVLLIFGVMLTAQSKFISMRTAAGDWILAVIVGGALLALLFRVAFSIPDWNLAPPTGEAASLTQGPTTSAIGLALTGIRLDGGSGYLLPFLIISIHLLVVLVGAGYLARTKRRVDQEEDS